MSNPWIRAMRHTTTPKPANRSMLIASRVGGPANGYREVTVPFERLELEVDTEEAQPSDRASADPPAQRDRSFEQRIARLKRSFAVREYRR
jgi:hypothetical protein